MPKGEEKGHTPWSGRFAEPVDARVQRYTASVSFDRRLAEFDIQGSLAHARMLAACGILAARDLADIERGLAQVRDEIRDGRFQWALEAEDVHLNIERRLTALIGDAGKRLHTARSRNDQVATDIRLYLRAAIDDIVALLEQLSRALVDLAERHAATAMPGFTHLQVAQPVTFGHHLMAYYEMLRRDRERLADCRRRVNLLPLGAAALAGTTYPIDRERVARELGFDGLCANSIDAVSDRDFAAEFLFCAALAGVHLSRMAEGVILFCSAEHGFFELSDEFATGSSLMPQKKNPDVFELARGKTGSLIGWLSGTLATLKGLQSAYDKDLQEDKAPVFSAYDTLMALLPVMAGALRTLTIHPERMRAAIDAGMMATDLADYLAARGLPFRQAHELAGKAVQQAAAQGKSLDKLTLGEYQSISPAFEAGVFAVFDPQLSLSRRNVYGGSAPEAVAAQLEEARSTLG